MAQRTFFIGGRGGGGGGEGVDLDHHAVLSKSEI